MPRQTMTCSRCLRDQPMRAFRPDPRMTSGRRKPCRDCCAERQKQFRLRLKQALLDQATTDG